MADTETQSEPRTISPVTAFAAEGARAGLVTCLSCGAALLLDPRSELNVVDLHADWHARG